MSLVLVTPPAVAPIEMADVKAHLRVDYSDDDTLIAGYLAAAVEHAETFTGRALVEQTWDYYLDEFPRTGAIRLPRPPHIAVSGLFYNDAGGADLTFDPTSYSLIKGERKSLLVPGGSVSWPTARVMERSVRVRFTSGYVQPDNSPTGDIPADIRSAILLIVGTLYENREHVVIGQTAVEMPWAAEQLLRLKRAEMGLA